MEACCKAAGGQFAPRQAKHRFHLHRCTPACPSPPRMEHAAPPTPRLLTVSQLHAARARRRCRLPALTCMVHVRAQARLRLPRARPSPPASPLPRATPSPRYSCLNFTSAAARLPRGCVLVCRSRLHEAAPRVLHSGLGRGVVPPSRQTPPSNPRSVIPRTFLPDARRHATASEHWRPRHEIQHAPPAVGSPESRRKRTPAHVCRRQDDQPLLGEPKSGADCQVRS